jgi:8-oxo-dGTP diphosphatase
MAQKEKAIFMNLCMVYDGQGNILVQNRRKRDWSGITFPGGHVEAGESFADAVIREVWEETGLTIEHPVLCGIKQWTEEDGARAVVLFYKTDRFSGELKSSEEGEVFWVRREEFESLPLAADMAQTIRVFESDDFSECFYTQDETGKWRLNLQ